MLEAIIKKLTAKPVNKTIAKRPDGDFFPYVCHYDDTKVLTKNGELIEVIRVTGLDGNDVALDLISLRDSIRDAIFDNVEDDRFAFWFHTIRRKKSLLNNDDSKFIDPICREVNEKWVEENELDKQFVNEFYISIIRQGLDSSITDSKTLARSFSYKAIQKLHREHLEESAQKLCDLRKKILVEIEGHGAKTLTIKEWDGVLYSEVTRFFGKIGNLYEERYPLSANDISEDLSSHKIAFGNREIEVATPKGKNFAALMTIKEYHEVSVESLDRILSLPFEFIITQSFDFCASREDLEQHDYNNDILKISGDESFRSLAGYKNFVESDSGKETDYGKLQNSLTVISSDRDDLEVDVILAIEEFSALGFALVREDVFLEHCFWAQLPANFAFLRRQKVINSLRVPGFAALHSFPSGSFAKNHWGSAVTTLKTSARTPYFFNFHENDLGHSLIFGPKGSGKTILTNFLLAQAQKFAPRVFYFDFNQSSKCFVKALGGDYYRLNEEEGADNLALNPFSLPKNKENSAFLFNFIRFLLAFSKTKMSQREAKALNSVIEQVLGQKDPDFLLAFDALRGQDSRRVYEKLKIWANGKLAYIFGAQKEIDWQNPMIGFDLSEIINQKPILIPVMAYLFHKIETLLDGTSSIIVIDECFEFLDNPLFVNILGDVLQRLREKNCMVIFNSPSHLYIGESKIAKIIAENVATEIYLPDFNPKPYYSEIFGLNEPEIQALAHMADDSGRHALLKHSTDSLVIDCDLSFFEDFLAILSSDEVTLAALDEVLATHKEKVGAEIWTQELIEVIHEIKAQKIVEKQKIEKIKAQNQKEEVEEFEIDESLQEELDEDAEIV